MAQEDVTGLLQDLEGGNRQAFDRLLAVVYPELRRMAQARLRQDNAGETMNPTALVHEAYLKLVRYQEVDWKGRAHFFGAVSQTMRRILVDDARARSAGKRKGIHIGLTDAGETGDETSMEKLLEIDDALRRLEAERPVWVRVVECRYFVGLNIEETATALDISHGTVSNYWRMARAWLQRELEA